MNVVVFILAQCPDGISKIVCASQFYYYSVFRKHELEKVSHFSFAFDGTNYFPL